MNHTFDDRLFQMAKQENMAMPDELNERLEEIFSEIRKTKSRKRMSMRAAVLLAAVLIMAFSITATAAVSLVRQRMEALNKEKLEEYFLDCQNSFVGADYRNRDYSNAEEKRLEKLRKAYEEGLFPTGSLTLIEDSNDYKGKGVAFFPKGSTFFLPESELTDEELLQIIDFYAKRDYSIRKLNKMEEAGEGELPTAEKRQPAGTKEAVLSSSAVFEPDRELVISYEGNLELTQMTAGKDCIFLAGWNDGIHKMEIGGSKSEPFFHDFGGEDIRVDAMYQADDGILYIGIRRYDQEEKIRSLEVWGIDEDGNVRKRIDVSDLTIFTEDGTVVFRIIKRIVVDADGYIYLRFIGSSPAIAVVLDENGNQVSVVRDDRYRSHGSAGMCIGKDGKVYVNIEESSEQEDLSDLKTGIASINPVEGRIEDIHMGIITSPGAYQFPLDILSPGINTDFIFWGFDGIFTYNLGDKEAKQIMAPYEAPCQWEGVRYAILPDGRVVFASITDGYEYTTKKGSIQYRAVPESITFYYVPTVR